jgi:hypothetical protein
MADDDPVDGARVEHDPPDDTVRRRVDPLGEHWPGSESSLALVLRLAVRSCFWR